MIVGVHLYLSMTYIGLFVLLKIYLFVQIFTMICINYRSVNVGR